MGYYDQHVHSCYSFDSTESLSAYLELNMTTLVTTEHLDFDNPYDDFKNNLPDYLTYSKEIDNLKNTYDGHILKGIEIGYLNKHASQIKDFLRGKEYDLLVLSVHQNGHLDYMDPAVTRLNKREVVHTYYQELLTAVTDIPYANILAHFDYGVRALELTTSEFQDLAEPLLIELFRLIIKHDIAFELNGKSFVTYKNKHLYEYAVPLYQSLGGKLFSIGSDAHSIDQYELGFIEMKKLLRKNGVHQLATYQKQALKLVPF